MRHVWLLAVLLTLTITSLTYIFWRIRLMRDDYAETSININDEVYAMKKIGISDNTWDAMLVPMTALPVLLGLVAAAWQMMIFVSKKDKSHSKSNSNSNSNSNEQNKNK